MSAARAFDLAVLGFGPERRRGQEAYVRAEHQETVRKTTLPIVRVLSRFDEVPHAGDGVHREQRADAGGCRQVRILLVAARVRVERLPDDRFRGEERQRGEARHAMDLRTQAVGVAVLERARRRRGRVLGGRCGRGNGDDHPLGRLGDRLRECLLRERHAEHQDTSQWDDSEPHLVLVSSMAGSGLRGGGGRLLSLAEHSKRG